MQQLAKSLSAHLLVKYDAASIQSLEPKLVSLLNKMRAGDSEEEHGEIQGGIFDIMYKDSGLAEKLN